jgi:pyruvate,water dikinase
MVPTTPYVLHFRDLGREARSLVGGKNASLGELLRAGTRVPAGFAITTYAYECFLDRAGLREALRDSAAAVDPADPLSLEHASHAARELIEGAPLPADLAQALDASYEVLAQEAGVLDPPVAVRSSATSEDSADASFAGQQETYLWVRGADSLARHAVRCWSSLYTPQALAYRARMGYPLDGASMSVGVQRMVDARAAGVLFTLNPLNGDPSKIVIEASWGLGTSVVGGEITPDRYSVDKVTLAVLSRTISLKSSQDLPAPAGGVARAAVPTELQDAPCLSDDEVRELALLGKLIERREGAPQDIEWATDRRLPFPANVLLLQSRPETVWSRRAAKPIVTPKATALDYVTDAMLSRLRNPRS